MADATTGREVLREQVWLGDEAVAEGAVDAGVTAAYGYPGTPSTEILEHLLRRSRSSGRPVASWCANEKTAYEAALGVSMAGRRALVAMKHVGLNVAADAFVNSALVDLEGGLVVVVADDPGMHSSQNEQDTRWLADFARVPCLEPADAQQAYEATREAFDLSERFRVPVVVRLVTRLAHGRQAVRPAPARPESPLALRADPSAWILLPVNARRQWRKLLEAHDAMRSWSEESPWQVLRLRPERGGLGVVTTGIARNHLLEALGGDLAGISHLQVGAYPVPEGLLRRLAAHADRLVVLEEGYPYVERLLRGVFPPPIEVAGKTTGAVPLAGELTPDAVRAALGIPRREPMAPPGFAVPARPPQLCTGCPHRDSFDAIREALAGIDTALVTSDIGCYTLGALPPYRAIQSCVCMGASVGMARGAADAGVHPAVAVIGDSTFLHSGVTALMDAVAADADMTLVILDNETVGMTGQQATVLPGSRLEPVVLGVGVDPAHCHVVEANPRKVHEIADVLRREIAHRGLSVVIAVRTCIQAAKKERRSE